MSPDDDMRVVKEVVANRHFMSSVGATLAVALGRVVERCGLVDPDGKCEINSLRLSHTYPSLSHIFAT